MMECPAPLQLASASGITHDALVSPIIQSPRRALQSLSPNPRTSPVRRVGDVEFASKSSVQTSPMRTTAPLIPATLSVMKESFQSRNGLVSSKKRTFNDIAASEESELTPRPASKEPRLHEPTTMIEDRSTENAPTPTVKILAVTSDQPSPTSDAPSQNNQQESGEVLGVKVGPSFSSLIDYDPSNASVNSNGSLSPDAGPEDMSLQSRTNALRLRLQMAMFRIKTDQMNLPISQLRLPPPTKATRSQPSSSLILFQPSASPTCCRSASTSSIEQDSSQELPNSGPPPSHEVDQAPGSLKLLPGPVLQPTAFSWRKIAAPYVSPSPPGGGSPEKASSTKYQTPVRVETHLGLITALSSPDKERLRDDDLTSSVVKGRAATGLLELHRGV